MSKIGKIPIQLPSGVTFSNEGNRVTITGTKGTLSFLLTEGISVKQEDDKLFVESDNGNQAALYGLSRAQLANMVKGVSEGFEKKLELSGVGYRAQVSEKDLLLSVGYSHQVKIPAPEGISFSVSENTITVSGFDKVLVGDIAAKIRMVRKPEPYKGKGISYKGERIRRKAGKAAKAVGAK